MASPQQPVVTGDAVVLDIQIAQLPVRVVATVIDVVVIVIVYVLGVVLWALTLSQWDSALSDAVLIVFIVPALMNDYNGRALHDRATGTAMIRTR